MPVLNLKGRLLFLFLPRGLHRQSSDSHETQLTCRVEACSPVTRASNYHCLLPYQCPYPPAVPCLRSMRHFQPLLSVCVCRCWCCCGQTITQINFVCIPVVAYAWIWVRRCLNLDWLAHRDRLNSYACVTECVSVFYQACTNVYRTTTVVLFVTGILNDETAVILLLLTDSLLIAAGEIALWLIAVVCDLYSRCNSPTPQGLHTSAVVTVTYWGPSSWQHHQRGLSHYFYCQLREFELG